MEAEGETLYRHPYADDSGEMPQALRSVCVCAPGSAAEAAYQAVRLMNCGSASEAADFARALGLPAAYTAGGEKTVFLNAPAAERFEAEDYGWSLRPIG